MKSEVWKSISGYGGHYEASSFGRVRSVDRVVMIKGKGGTIRECRYTGKVLSPGAHNCKRSNIKTRLDVVLSKQGKTKTYQIHNLIAATFIPKENDDMTVNHKDGNPLNNNVDNLEWISKCDNIRHSFENGLVKTQKPVAQMDDKGNIIKAFPGESEACRRMGVAQGKISRAINRNGKSCGYKWKFINDEPVTTIEKWRGFSNGVE